jgi:carboxyl-terminal processing protease
MKFIALPALLLSVCSLAIAAPPTPATPNTTTSKSAQIVLPGDEAAALRATDLGLITTKAPPIAAGANDASISRLTASLLARYHYAQKEFNDEVSSQFFDRYLEALDNQRIHFLQSDIAEFEKFRTVLDDLTLGTGDTSPANVIFNRFLQRVQERVAYVNEMLPKETFVFDSDDKVIINRKELPRPKTPAEARQLWHERLRYEILQEKLNKEKPDEIVKIIQRRYARLLRSLREFDSDDVLQVYLSALAHVYDPHSDYMGRSQMENFSIGMKLSLVGIGALLRSEDGYCKIQELMPGPAMKSKLIKPNDRIIAVAQGTNAPVDVVDMKLNKVVEMIRGRKGTEVRLTIIPADAADSSTRKVVSLIRDEIQLEDQQAKAKLIELPTAKENAKPLRLGIIDLPSFYSDFGPRPTSGERKSTTTDVAKLLKKLNEENVNGIILDLRRNGGGSLEEAINLTGLFIKEGPVVQVKDPDGSVQVDSDRDPRVQYDGPLIVLTSRFSASASEILAGALQDYDRALIVGDKSTHGKGTVQQLVELRGIMQRIQPGADFEPGALKVTIRKFYRASGASTQLEGVTPDIILPSVNNVADVGEKALENPLPYDTIKSASFDKVGRVQSHLAELRHRTEKRIGTNVDFGYIREDIEIYRKNKEEKSISLNEGARLKEKQEAETRTKSRKEEVKARPDAKEKIYEITLKVAEQAGLPAPMAKTNLTASVKGAAHTDAKAANPKEAKKSPGRSLDDDDEAEEETVPSVDVNLEEAKRVLVDLISLTAKSVTLTQSKPQTR